MSDDLGFFFLLMSNGVLIGLMYSLIALGFVLVYKATDAINFAQGEFVMIAGFVVAVAITAYGAPLWLAVLVGLAGMIGFGFGLERVMLRKLIGRPVIAVVMATIGLAAILRGFGPMVWGAGTKSLALPIPEEPIILGPLFIPPIQLLGAAVSLLPAGTASPDAPPPSGFFADGLHHILIGADHVLFLVCLLLPVVLGRTGEHRSGRSLAWALVGLVSAFTVGHSITLGLAAWRLLSVPPSVIEPLIAATIALAAVDNLRPWLGKRRSLAALAFGLIHGFGFAGPLLEIELPPAAMAWALLQFNLGVEAGQLLVVMLALALLWPLRRHGIWARRTLAGGSLAAGVMALVWFGERVLDTRLLAL